MRSDLTPPRRVGLISKSGRAAHGGGLVAHARTADIGSAEPYRGESNKLVADLDRRKRGQAFQPGRGMVNRFATAQSTVAMRHWGPRAIVTLAAMAALTALTTDAAAKQARPAPPTQAPAPPVPRDP